MYDIITTGLGTFLWIVGTLMFRGNEKESWRKFGQIISGIGAVLVIVGIVLTVDFRLESEREATKERILEIFHRDVVTSHMEMLGSIRLIENQNKQEQNKELEHQIIAMRHVYNLHRHGPLIADIEGNKSLQSVWFSYSNLAVKYTRMIGEGIPSEEKLKGIPEDLDKHLSNLLNMFADLH